MNNPVRFGLIGFGAWGQCHASAIEKTEGAELIAIAAKSEATLDRAREARPTAQHYLDFRDLLSNEDVDVVDIVVPSDLHYEVASAALESGKHVLLEKPMCLNLDHCDALIRIADSQESPSRDWTRAAAVVALESREADDR